MNNVNLLGRVTADPTIYENNKGLIANFTVAINRINKDEADFIKCVAFGKTAEYIDEYLKKGMRIAVNGRIQTGSYENKDGNTIYTTDVICERTEILFDKKEIIKRSRK